MNLLRQLEIEEPEPDDVWDVPEAVPNEPQPRHPIEIDEEAP